MGETLGRQRRHFGSVVFLGFRRRLFHLAHARPPDLAGLSRPLARDSVEIGQFDKGPFGASAKFDNGIGRSYVSRAAAFAGWAVTPPKPARQRIPCWASTRSPPSSSARPTSAKSSPYGRP